MQKTEDIDYKKEIVYLRSPSFFGKRSVALAEVGIGFAEARLEGGRLLVGVEMGEIAEAGAAPESLPGFPRCGQRCRDKGRGPGFVRRIQPSAPCDPCFYRHTKS